MPVAVIGAGGQLGRQIPADIRPPRSELDLTQPDTIYASLDRHHPEGVLLAGAYTDVDGCESHPADAFAVNAEGPRHVARWCARNGAWLLYISSNCVFDGQRAGPYHEDDAPNPISVYGASKLAGELAAKEETDRLFIVRGSWLFGPGGANFVTKALGWAKTQPVLTGVDDEIATPTYAPDLGPALSRLAATGRYGTYHLVNGGACSRLEWIEAILDIAGLQRPIRPVHLADFPRPSRPPAYSVLANERAAALGITLRPWRDALAEYVHQGMALENLG